MYISQDPIGLAGNNPNFYAYVFDSNMQVDVFGVDCNTIEKLIKFLMRIRKYLNAGNFMLNSSICRLEEKESVIIVSEEFKKISLKHKLKGMDFVEEGYSIYTNL